MKNKKVKKKEKECSSSTTGVHRCLYCGKYGRYFRERTILDELKTNQNNIIDSVMKEQLADIEHQRWADWQKYLHSRCKKDKRGNLVIPVEYVENLERQIRADYKDLTEKEKDSDREQVDRYLPILSQTIKAVLKDVWMKMSNVKQEPFDMAIGDSKDFERGFRQGFEVCWSKMLDEISD